MNVGTKGHIDHGCDLCGCKGIHACTGKPMAPWSLEEKNKLNDALCSIANREQPNQYQRLVSVEGGRVFYRVVSMDGHWFTMTKVMVDDGTQHPAKWPSHTSIYSTHNPETEHFDNMEWHVKWVKRKKQSDSQSMFHCLEKFAK